MAKKQPMRIIALAASKGGVGKSTLTAALAVRAAEESNRVAIIDMDPQLSLASWRRRRGVDGNPQLFEDVDSAAEAIELIASEGWDWLFLDTPPSQLDIIETVISSADLVLIPTKASMVDVEAIHITEEVCQEQSKPYAFILNMVPTRASRATDAVASNLRLNRRMLLTPYISNRQSHVDAMFAGKSAAEVRDPAARQEIDELWKSVRAFAQKVRK